MKKHRLIYLSVVAAAMVLVGSVAYASAQASLVNSSETSSQVSSGQANTFTATIGGTDTDQTVLVDLEVKDANGQKVAQAFFDNQTIHAGQTQNFTLASPTSLPDGNYSFSVGIFNPGWSSLEQWYESVQKFTIGNSVASGGTTPHNVIAPDTCCFVVTPGFNVTRGQPVSDTIKLTNTDSVSHTVLIDLEVHPANGPDQKMDQNFYDNQTFAPGETKTYTMTTQTGSYPSNQYDFRLGIFNPGWNGLIDWWNGLGSFQVQ